MPVTAIRLIDSFCLLIVTIYSEAMFRKGVVLMRGCILIIIVTRYININLPLNLLAYVLSGGDKTNAMFGK